VELAPSTRHKRTKALRKRGILLGSPAEIKFPAIGLTLEALLFVRLAKFKRQVVDKFLGDTAAVPEVRSVSVISRRFDLSAYVVIRDMDHLKSLICAEFNRHALVVRVETALVFTRGVRHGMPLRIRSKIPETCG
jgi:DNA-binding Lrp family transcriptional regulator